MKTRKLVTSALWAAGVLVPGVWVPEAAQAAVVTGNLTVTLEVQAVCQIEGNPALTFTLRGTQVTAAIEQEAELRVTCSDGSPYTVGLDAGQYAHGKQRHMKNAAGAQRVAYEIYQDPALSRSWGDSGVFEQQSETGNDTPQSFRVYARLKPQKGLAPGRYTDTVKIAVVY